MPGYGTVILDEAFDRAGTAVRSRLRDCPADREAGRRARGSPDLGIGSLPPLREMVLLNPALLPGMPKVLASTVAGLAELPITPSTVLIRENREGVHALPQIPGTVAIAGSGNAVTDLAAIGWVQSDDIV